MNITIEQREQVLPQTGASISCFVICTHVMKRHTSSSYLSTFADIKEPRSATKATILRSSSPICVASIRVGKTPSLPIESQSSTTDTTVMMACKKQEGLSFCIQHKACLVAQRTKLQRSVRHYHMRHTYRVVPGVQDAVPTKMTSISEVVEFLNIG